MSLISALLQQSSASGSRSTTLKPLNWLVAFLLIATVGGSTYAETDRWLLILLATLTVVSVILYVFAYIYFMFKNPDALRSEKFNIEKMAIQKGIVGDSQLGVIEQNSASNDIEANEDHDSFSSNSLGHK